MQASVIVPVHEPTSGGSVRENEILIFRFMVGTVSRYHFFHAKKPPGPARSYRRRSKRVEAYRNAVCRVAIEARSRHRRDRDACLDRDVTPLSRHGVVTEVVDAQRPVYPRRVKRFL